MMRRLARPLAALALAATFWLPLVHFGLRPVAAAPSPAGMGSSWAHELAAAQIELWSDTTQRGIETRQLRRANAEWDFMGRTFNVLALLNMALREPEQRARYLAIADRIIDDTMHAEQSHDVHFFLMPYSRAKPFVSQPARSLFIDGEIALMLGARRALDERADYREAFAFYRDQAQRRMQDAPLLSAESYPDECWTFCNTVTLAALRLGDAVDGTDHSAFFSAWVRGARARLVEPQTGLLVSSFRRDGTWLDGPEGSSLWMSAHCLQLIDPEFAEDQYRRGRKELGRTILGFGYAREWPPAHQGPVDIDSGPIVPGLEASPGSSGLALLGAGAFGDDTFFTALGASVELGGFPVRKNGALRYRASNAVGDAVVFYAAAQGPLWRKIEGVAKP